jgi:hypothetical protein
MFKIRLSGTSDFLSNIDWTVKECIFVKGWDNPSTLMFLTREAAEIAIEAVSEIEGFRTSLEEF